MDTRYLISNSKDQSIKLWDMRHFANESTVQRSRDISNNINNSWDYRYEVYEPKRIKITVFSCSNYVTFIFS